MDGRPWTQHAECRSVLYITWNLASVSSMWGFRFLDRHLEIPKHFHRWSNLKVCGMIWDSLLLASVSQTSLTQFNCPLVMQQHCQVSHWLYQTLRHLQSQMRHGCISALLLSSLSSWVSGVISFGYVMKRKCHGWPRQISLSISAETTVPSTDIFRCSSELEWRQQSLHSIVFGAGLKPKF